MKKGRLFFDILSAVSAIVTIITLATNNIHPQIGIPIILSIAVLAFIVHTFVPKSNLPTGLDQFVEDLENPNMKQPYKIIFPCDDLLYKAVNKLAKEKFGKNTVSSKTANDWKKRNEFLLTCLFDRNRLVGYFDILPLDSRFADRLMNGEAGEKDIKAEHILSVYQMKDAEYLYFAGIAIQDTETSRGLRAGGYLILAAILYVCLFYSNGKVKKILTIPTTDCGLAITKHLNFSLERERNLRKDGFDLYSHDFNLHELITLVNRQLAVYNRFDISSYFQIFQQLTGKVVNLPVSVNFAKGR